MTLNRPTDRPTDRPTGDTPLISVIIPIYNAEKTLARCIDSLMKQSFSDFEILLIDDGSTDSSLDICQKYAAGNAGIKVLHHENAGVSVTRNCGIENASGKFLMFCDSDDYASPDWCEKLLQGGYEQRRMPGWSQTLIR